MPDWELVDILKCCHKGGCSDADESLWIPRGAGQKGPDAFEGCVFANTVAIVADGAQAWCVCALLYHNRDQLKAVCPDFGTHPGFDGEKLNSHLTGRTCANGTCREPDANWRCPKCRIQDFNGKKLEHDGEIVQYALSGVGDIDLWY